MMEGIKKITIIVAINNLGSLLKSVLLTCFKNAIQLNIKYVSGTES